MGSRDQEVVYKGGQQFPRSGWVALALATLTGSPLLESGQSQSSMT